MAKRVSLEQERTSHTNFHWYTRFWRVLQEEDGAHLVLWAVGLFLLLGLAGLAIDGSNLYLQTQRMQIAADAAALGGARKLATDANTPHVDAEIEDLAFSNQADHVEWDYTDDNRGVSVTAERTFPSYFASVLGYYTFTVQAEAEAHYQPVSAADNLFPLTFSCDCWDDNGIIRVESATTVTVPLEPSCTAMACLTSAPRLLSLNTNESALLNPLLQGLLGVSLNVNVVDWNGLATSDVTLGELQTALGVATPAELLSTPITLGQLLSGLHGALPGGLPGSLSSIIVQMPAGTILLGDILDIDPNVPAFSEIDLNALDLVTAAIELFNYQNVVNSEVHIGLPVGGVVNNGVTLKVKVIEPPLFICGDAGTTFHSAAIRLAVHVDVADLSRSLNLGLISTSVTVGQLDLYIEVASGTGWIDAVDAIAKTVTVQAVPSIANLYVGTVSDDLFFQTTPINPLTDLDHGTIGQVQVKLLSILGIPLLSTQANLGLKLHAEGTSVGAQTLFFTGHGSGTYPETLTATAGAGSLSTLLSSLIDSLGDSDAIQADLNISVLNVIHISLGQVTSLVTDILSVLLDTTSGVLYATLSNVLSGVLDPLLDLLGVGLGEMDVTVLGVVDPCGPNVGEEEQEESCPFQWVDWNGVATSSTEIASYMHDLSQSGIWRIGEIIPVEWDTQYSSVVNTELEAREDTVVSIPLTQASGDDYAICGFTNVELVDHDLEKGWLKLRVVSQLIHGVEVSPGITDHAARDVRLTR